MIHKLSKQAILAVNAGSSSIKFSLFESDEVFTELFKGSIDRIESKEAVFQVKALDSKLNFSKNIPFLDFAGIIALLTQWIEQNTGDIQLLAIGHRVVHGGTKYYKAKEINEEVIRDLQSLDLFAPGHLFKEIVLIEAFYEKFPAVPQFACFDTAFHHTLPKVAKLLPIPRCYALKGIQRYGFHGLSYEFLMEELNRLEGIKAAQGKVVLAHLGSGSSLAAIDKGKSIDTSMGFSPSSGVPMSTRSGDLDPGLFHYLSITEKLTIEQFNEMINFKSGLLGLSETSSDMRDLLSLETSDVRAAEAIEVFCYQVKKWIGAFAAALKGIDILVFSGGIGENMPSIRARICEGLEFLGLEIEEEKNKTNQQVISVSNKRVTIHVIHTNEEKMIAKTIFHLLDLKIKSTKT